MSKEKDYEALKNLSLIRAILDKTKKENKSKQEKPQKKSGTLNISN